jgi:hypothetical protein
VVKGVLEGHRIDSCTTTNIASGVWVKRRLALRLANIYWQFYTRRLDLRHNCIILSLRSHLDHEKFIKLCCDSKDALILLGSKFREWYNLSLLVVVVKHEHLYPETATIYQS